MKMDQVSWNEILLQQSATRLVGVKISQQRLPSTVIESIGFWFNKLKSLDFVEYQSTRSSAMPRAFTVTYKEESVEYLLFTTQLADMPPTLPYQGQQFKQKSKGSFTLDLRDFIPQVVSLQFLPSFLYTCNELLQTIHQEKDIYYVSL